MLMKRRCPLTGVVNFYSNADPHMAVGSVVRGDDTHFTWRFYGEPFARGGMAVDLPSAERHVLEAGRLAALNRATARPAA